MQLRKLSPARLLVERLETRELLSVNVQSLFRGMTGTAANEPPDTIAAAGPDVIVELVNGTASNHATVAYYDKSSGGKLFQQDLSVFFKPLGSVLFQGDVAVAYDELAGRFALGCLDTNLTSKSRFDFAVSNDSNPLDGFQLARYDMNDGVGGFDFADFPRLGYNADAYVVTFDMFPNGLPRDHVDTLAIDKTSLTGHRVQVPGGAANFVMAPAAMHDARPGDPIWFTEASSESGGNTIGVVEMTDVLSDTPTFTVTQVAVPDYFGVPYVFGAQPFSPFVINTDDARIFNSAMRFGQIVAAQAVADFDNVATHVRWYQFDTTGEKPLLVQMGNIDQGSANTYYPSIDINALGDLGMTFMESSDTEYMSMYVTGRNSTDPLNTMQPAVLVFAGQDLYQGGRAGDFSGTTVDPVDGITFWSANEYKPRDSFWGTGIASFTVSNAPPPPAPGSGNPSEDRLLFLPPATVHALFDLAVLPTPSDQAKLDSAVPDGSFDLSKGQRQSLMSYDAVRSLLVNQKTNVDFWDNLSCQPLTKSVGSDG